MDDIDKRILNRLQFDFPIDLQPYRRIAEAVGTTEEDVLARVDRLRKEGVIREISAIFDTRNLGYMSSLAAMRIPVERLEAAAKAINDFPGVSHNYRRDASFNLWFTVAVPPERDLNETVKILSYETEAEATLVLPTLKLFKIGVRLDVTGQSNGLEQEEAQVFKRVRRSLTDPEREAVRVLQEDLAAVSRPFAGMAQRIGVSEEGLLGMIRSFMEEGMMRRYAAVLHHRKAGFAFNGMGVWKVPEGEIDSLGAKIGSFRGVSHCYRRPSYPEWPYSLYTMVHGMKKEDCEKIIAGIAQATGVPDYKVLYSTVEYKKDRIEYFSKEFDAWYEAHPCPAEYHPSNLRAIESYAAMY